MDIYLLSTIQLLLLGFITSQISLLEVSINQIFQRDQSFLSNTFAKIFTSLMLYNVFKIFILNKNILKILFYQFFCTRKQQKNIYQSMMRQSDSGQVVCSNNVLSKFVCRSFKICFERKVTNFERKVTFFRIHAQMKFSFEIRSFEIRKNVIQRKKMNLVSFLTSVVGQVRLGQVRIGYVMLCQVRLGQVRLGQVRLGQARLGQARLGQVRLGQVRLGRVVQVMNKYGR